MMVDAVAEDTPAEAVDAQSEKKEPCAIFAEFQSLRAELSDHCGRDNDVAMSNLLVAKHLAELTAAVRAASGQTTKEKKKPADA